MQDREEGRGVNRGRGKKPITRCIGRGKKDERAFEQKGSSFRVLKTTQSGKEKAGPGRGRRIEPKEGTERCGICDKWFEFTKVCKKKGDSE